MNVKGGTEQGKIKPQTHSVVSIKSGRPSKPQAGHLCPRWSPPLLGQHVYMWVREASGASTLLPVHMELKAKSSGHSLCPCLHLVRFSDRAFKGLLDMVSWPWSFFLDQVSKMPFEIWNFMAQRWSCSWKREKFLHCLFRKLGVFFTITSKLDKLFLNVESETIPMNFLCVISFHWFVLHFE